MDYEAAIFDLHGTLLNSMGIMGTHRYCDSLVSEFKEKAGVRISSEPIALQWDKARIEQTKKKDFSFSSFYGFDLHIFQEVCGPHPPINFPKVKEWKLLFIIDNCIVLC